MMRYRRIQVDLIEVVAEMKGRPVPVGDVIRALDMGTSTYYEQRDDGRLLEAENLVFLAANLGLNPVELMLRCGRITANAVTECAEKIAGGSVGGPPRRRSLKRRSDLPPL